MATPIVIYDQSTNTHRPATENDVLHIGTNQFAVNLATKTISWKEDDVAKSVDITALVTDLHLTAGSFQDNILTLELNDGEKVAIDLSAISRAVIQGTKDRVIVKGTGAAKDPFVIDVDQKLIDNIIKNAGKIDSIIGKDGIDVITSNKVSQVSLALEAAAAIAPVATTDGSITTKTIGKADALLGSPDAWATVTLADGTTARVPLYK